MQKENKANQSKAHRTEAKQSKTNSVSGRTKEVMMSRKAMQIRKKKSSKQEPQY